jgi:hypothetical protein
MYLVPPSDVSRKFFTDERRHMVGVFVDQQSAALQSARFSGQRSGN